MLKNLLEDLKAVATWEEANTWLSVHGWGLGLIEEQKVLWNEFKKSGNDTAELVFDPTTASIVIVAPVAVAPVTPAPTKPTK